MTPSILPSLRPNADVEDDGERLYELERVAVPSPGEIRLLHRLGAGHAHRRLTAYVDEYTRAMAADADAKRCAARDEEQLEQLREDYDRIVSQHGRAEEAAWAEHRRLLERASSSGLAEAAKAHNAAPTWPGLGALQRAAETRGALQREGETKIRPRARVHGPRPRPRQHRAVARRRRRLARSSSRSADPGDDGDGGPGTFASFHRATPGLTGAQRLCVFESLPEELKALYWEDLARSVERGRR